MKLSLACLALVALIFVACDSKTPEFADVNVEVVASGFKIPWGIEVISETEFLFTERMGTLYHFENGETKALNGLPRTATVEVAGLTYGGYMDVSLHPEFDSNGLVYLAYVNEQYSMVVARFSFRNKAVEDVEVIFDSHAFSIGSRIAWSDASHFFVTQGFGGNPYPEPGPQDLTSSGGKIHRLMADGSIPPDNPTFDGATEEPTSIWSYGHRDPQGLYYEASTGVMYANEHGPLGGDELNVINKGGNYGWPLFSYGRNYDGTPVSDMTEEAAKTTTVLPIKHWMEDFNIAPSGLLRLENSAFKHWNGSFVMGSLAQQRLIAYNDDTDETMILLDGIGRVRDVAQLPSGNVLLLLDARSPSFFDRGRIVKLSPK